MARRLPPKRPVPRRQPKRAQNAYAQRYAAQGRYYQTGRYDTGLGEQRARATRRAYKNAVYTPPVEKPWWKGAPTRVPKRPYAPGGAAQTAAPAQVPASAAAASGGGPIPGAGFYGQDMAMAEKAYSDATAMLTAQRRQRQVSAGMDEKWQVDPKSELGGYQQLLRGQGSQLDEAEQHGHERGLWGAGLGQQEGSNLRYGHRVQGLEFQNQLAAWEQEYNQGLAQAAMDRQMADLDAQQGGYEDAFNEGDFTPYDPTKVTAGKTKDLNRYLYGTYKQGKAKSPFAQSKNTYSRRATYVLGARANAMAKYYNKPKAKPKPKTKPKTKPKGKGK